MALAILLWKDFKCNGKFDTDLTLQALALAKDLGVAKELEVLFSQLPPMRIEPR